MPPQAALGSWERRAGSRATAQAVLGALFPAKPGKTDGLFHSFPVEIWLRVNGDEESQLQPGGEEVRALQPLPFPLQPPACRTGSLPPSSHRGVGNPRAGLTFGNIQEWGLPGEPGNGEGGGPRRTKAQSQGCLWIPVIPWDDTLKLLSSA